MTLVFTFLKDKCFVFQSTVFVDMVKSSGKRRRGDFQCRIEWSQWDDDFNMEYSRPGCYKVSLSNK